VVRSGFGCGQQGGVQSKGGHGGDALCTGAGGYQGGKWQDLLLNAEVRILASCVGWL
jgi:hypothetical protein